MSNTDLKADLLTGKIWNMQYKSLDHWRGIAILWVMIFHGFGTTYYESLHPIAELVKAVAAPGWLGVHLFFVISGYCIAANVYRLVLSNGSPWTFLKNRTWRLLPVYWASFFLTLGLNLVSYPFNRTSFWDNFPSSWQSWLGNILLIQPYLDAPYYGVVYWSLVVEMGFYLIVALLLIIKGKINLKLALFIGLSLGFASVFLAPSPRVMTLTYWCEFVCGVLVFSALLSKKQDHIYRHKLSLALIVIFGILSIFVNWKFFNSTLWFSALFAIVLYWLYFIDEKIDSIKQIKWIKFVGIMSYSLYLIHVPFQGRVISLGGRFIPYQSPMILLLQGLGWGVAIFVSYLFYRLVEKPLNDWRHRQKKSINRRYENSVNG
ncbi:MAG TPA: acyltransferase [Coleofasciculaceae cyanobacterium]|jgi:peptidoglycan/LPS O-acetylase OafA/YrhL